MVQENCNICYKCSFIISISIISGLLNSISYDRPLPVKKKKIMLADSSNGSGSYTLDGGIFLSSSLCFMAMCW